jgi:hypothetical protein
VQLTTTQVSLVAARIALAAPASTYRANVRLDLDLDRDPWWRRTRRAA